MIRRAQIPFIFLGFLLAACASGPVGAQPGEPAFIVLTKNPDDKVEVQVQNGAAWIDIQSPTGIGAASFELESGTMPEDMTLRLHLKGLEQIRLKSAQDQLAASVSGGAPFRDHQTILSSGAETPLLPGHPLWMKIDLVSRQAEKTVPLEEGYFEVSVPQEFIQNAGTMFEIEWIDFYR